MSGSASTPAENAAPDKYMAAKPISSISRPTSAFGAPGTWMAVAAIVARSISPGVSEDSGMVVGIRISENDSQQ